MTDYERIQKVLEHITETYLEQPSLTELAQVAGLSESYFQRLFTRWAGTSPKSFLQYLTAKHAKSLLLQSRDLLTASLDSGLSGPGRLHDLLVSIEAMSPGELKAQGSGVEIRYGFHPTVFGSCLIGVTKRGVCHLVFVDSNEQQAVTELKSSWPRAQFIEDGKSTKQTVDLIFKKQKDEKLSIFLKGTPFQIKVWEALLRIPEGHVLSYADIAQLIGSPKAARAVGTAIGQNSIGYLIPCHRVIRQTGVIGDYRWGTERKRAVLAWESAARNQTKKS